MKWHASRLVLSFLLSAVYMVPIAVGQAKKAAQNLPPIGQKVKVDWAGKEEEAEVVGHSRTGWVTVKFKRDGIELTPTLPAARMRLVGPSRPAAVAEKRIWTDTTGKFKTEATFQSLTGGVVELKKPDGAVARLPLDKLSPADQELAKKLAGADADDTPASEDPFATKPADANTTKETGSHTDTKNPAGLKITEPNWGGAGDVLLDDSVKIGGLIPDPEPPFGGQLANRGIPLSSAPSAKGARRSAFVNPKAYILQPGTSHVILALVDESPGTERSTRLVRCDLAAGALLENIELPGNSVPLDAEPTGRLMIARSDNFHIGTHGRADVFDISAKEPKHVISWLPYGDRDWGQRDVQFAALLDAQRACTVDNAGKLTVWQVDQAKAMYSVATWQGSTPAISGTGKYLAIVTKSGTFMLDAATGNALAKFVGQPGYGPRLSFRPDGKQLACVSGGLIQVWDVASGQMAYEVYLPSQSSTNSIAWPSDGYLLLNGGTLVDLPRRIVLWQYTGGSEWGTVVNDRYVYVAKGNDHSQTLVHAQLPHAQAQSLATSLNVDALLAVKPGTPIAVNTQVAMTPEEQQQVQEALAKKLAENGAVVTPGATIVLAATTEQGDTKNVEYRTIGRGFGTESISVTKQIQKVAITENGTPLWQVEQVKGAPFFLHTRGENLTTAIAEQTKPDVQFFASVMLPKHLTRPGPKTGGAYGESNLTPQGVQ